MWRIQAFDRDGREVASLDTPGGEVTIGREADRTIALVSPSVSRRHAKLVLDPPQPYVMDEGSANGVLVNGTKISGPTAIMAGVRVDIAEFRLEFSMVQQAPAPARRPVPFAAPPPAQAHSSALRLLGQDGPFAGQVFELSLSQIGVGRAIDNDLVFDHPSLSRKHARLRNNGDHLEIEDQGSSNGSYVNDERVQRGVARVGDLLRFGEVSFRLDGDQAQRQAPAGQWAPSAPAEEWAPPRPGPNPLLIYGGVGVGVAVVGVLLSLVLFRAKKPTPTVDPSVQIASQVASHLKAGRDKMDAKDFVGASKEFDQSLEADPGNAEARKLKSMALAEPQNDQLSRQAKAKAMIASSRADLETALKIEAQIPNESAFHDATATKVATKLVAFGLGQCKGKKWSDCAWAICKAGDVAPAADRGNVVGADGDGALKEAEKKLARDRSYTPCKRH